MTITSVITMCITADYVNNINDYYVSVDDDNNISDYHVHYSWLR